MKYSRITFETDLDLGNDPFYLIGDPFTGGPVATKFEYENGIVSTAYYYPLGKVLYPTERVTFSKRLYALYPNENS